LSGRQGIELRLGLDGHGAELIVGPQPQLRLEGINAVGVHVSGQQRAVATCGPTAGVGCVSAVVTFIVGAIGATITSVGLIAFDLIPSFDNVAKAFRAVDASAPAPAPQP